MSKRQILRWHLGLGDALICNGLVREMVKERILLTLPAHKHNIPSVSAMFEDLGDSVRVVEMTDRQIEECQSDIPGIGYFSPFFSPGPGWDQMFYEAIGVPFRCRWSSFKIPERFMSWTPVENPSFVHDDRSRDMTIRVIGIRPEFGQTIFDYIPLIQGAREIHCIDSCFAILADSIETTDRLHLHSYCRPFCPPTYKKRWNIITTP